MTLQTFGMRRVACSLLRLSALSLLLPLALTAAASPAATGETAVITYEAVSPPHRAAEIGYFGVSPESPNGGKIAYVAYDRTPGPVSAAGSAGSLYVCDADLGRHVKIRDLVRVRWEDGASQIWLDDDTLASMDYLPERGPVTYIIRRSGDLLGGPFEGCLGHGDTPDGSVLLWVDRQQYPNGSKLGPSGIFRYKGGAVTQVVNLERDFGPLKDRLEGSDDPAEWSMFHAQLSTNGTYISIRLDTKKGLEHLITCKSDGTDVRVFQTTKKPLHQQWYDDSTLFGHERAFKPEGGRLRFEAARWDRDGRFLERLAGVGNHMGISPDRKYLASDNMYELDPVVLKLYRTRNTQPLAVIMNAPAGPVWRMRTHVNPAFSRDGRKVYFNKPVDGMPQVVRADISNVIRARD